MGGRPGSQAMNRPGSGMRSSYGAQQAGAGNSLNTNVEVTASPTMMREGMKGVASRAGPPGTSAGFGPGRVAKDRSYWVGVLRPKVADLTAEIERLKGEEELYAAANVLEARKNMEIQATARKKIQEAQAQQARLRYKLLQQQMQMKMQGPGMAPVPGALHSAYPVVGGTRDKSGRQRS